MSLRSVVTLSQLVSLSYFWLCDPASVLLLSSPCLLIISDDFLMQTTSPGDGKRGGREQETTITHFLHNTYNAFKHISLCNALYGEYCCFLFHKGIWRRKYKICHKKYYYIINITIIQYYPALFQMIVLNKLHFIHMKYLIPSIISDVNQVFHTVLNLEKFHIKTITYFLTFY